MAQNFSIPFQALITSPTGEYLLKEGIELEINILQDSITGQAVFTEQHSCMSDDFGRINLFIGKGDSVMGSLAGIDWSASDYYLAIAYSLSKDAGYNLLGASRIKAVPYAMYAKKANNITSLKVGSGIGYNEPVFYNNAKDDTIRISGSSNVRVISNYPEFTIIPHNYSEDFTQVQNHHSLVYAHLADDVLNDSLQALQQHKQNLDTLFKGIVQNMYQDSLDIEAAIKLMEETTSNRLDHLKDSLGNVNKTALQALQNDIDNDFANKLNQQEQAIGNADSKRNTDSLSLEQKLAMIKKRMDSLDLQSRNNLWVSGYYIDPRDNQKYEVVRIGKQIWMASDLNYYTPEGSVYYNEDSITMCNEGYGRLYTWTTAMDIDARYNSETYDANPNENHQGICPPGWHLPSKKEWEDLGDYLGFDAGGKLKIDNLRTPDFSQN